jgi:AhpD family alkylhydroperoxidase
MNNLKRLSQLGRLAPEITAKFWQYDQAAVADGVIPKKYKELMAIAVALMTQCAYCIEVHRQKASQVGTSPAERGGESD